MIFYTMNRQFEKVEEIDKFVSGIWTERYYGDDEGKLIVANTPEMNRILAEGTFLGEQGSDIPMIIETAEVDNDKGTLEVSAISLLSWTNNRFIRSSPNHAVKVWTPATQKAGILIWWCLYYFCIEGYFLNDSVNQMGIPNGAALKLPISTYKTLDTSGPDLTLSITYGPVYDAMRDIATTYEIGMKITLEDDLTLKFSDYKGVDRTSRQSTYQVVRFSEELENLTKLKELRSIKNMRTLVYSFCPPNPDNLATTPGSASLATNATGFDLRALMTLEEDITQDQTNGNAALMLQILNERATKALYDHAYIRTIDGEIVPDFQFKYGVDYHLGDIIEVEGIGGIQTSRVTEYIRAQDATGEKDYPTVAMLE